MAQNGEIPLSQTFSTYAHADTRACLSDELLSCIIMILTPIMPTKLKCNLHFKWSRRKF